MDIEQFKCKSFSYINYGNQDPEYPPLNVIKLDTKVEDCEYSVEYPFFEKQEYNFIIEDTQKKVFTEKDEIDIIEKVRNTQSIIIEKPDTDEKDAEIETWD